MFVILKNRKERTTTLRKILLSPFEIMADYDFWILIGSSRGDDNRITIDDLEIWRSSPNRTSRQVSV